MKQMPYDSFMKNRYFAERSVEGSGGVYSEFGEEEREESMSKKEKKREIVTVEIHAPWWVKPVADREKTASFYKDNFKLVIDVFNNDYASNHPVKKEPVYIISEKKPEEDTGVYRELRKAFITKNVFDQLRDDYSDVEVEDNYYLISRIIMRNKKIVTTLSNKLLKRS